MVSDHGLGKGQTMGYGVDPETVIFGIAGFWVGFGASINFGHYPCFII